MNAGGLCGGLLACVLLLGEAASEHLLNAKPVPLWLTCLVAAVASMGHAWMSTAGKRRTSPRP